jgi:hypothetical protein
LFLTLDRLCERAEGLSNHVRRYTHRVRAHRAAVVARLEETGNLGRITFGDPAENLRAEMMLIVDVARDDRERIDFLGFYFALQYIIMEVRSLDILKYHLLLENQRSLACERCLCYAQQRFRELSSIYVDVLGEILLPPHFRDRFVLLAAGTRGDRDDIDVFAVDDLAADERRELSQGLSRLAQVMQRTACTLHFHLAEALGSPALSESVETYARFARGGPYEPVTISQILSGERLTGSPELATRFAREVSSRFHHHPGRDNSDHEGFLRAMLGELDEVLHRPLAVRTINPKEDGLRPIKGYLALAKSIYHVPHGDWFALLDFLSHRSSAHAREYGVLQDSLTFLETVRHLYQLLVVEEESIDTGDPLGSGGLASVATWMGFERRAGLGPEGPLLMAYSSCIESVREALHTLLVPVTEHLRRVTSLSFLLDPAEIAAAPLRSANLALRHVRAARPFFGTRFFGDLLEEFSRDDSPIPRRYVRDLCSLSPWRRDIVVRGLAAWGVQDPGSFLTFLVLLRRHTRGNGCEWLRDEILDTFLRACRDESRMAERLASLFEIRGLVLARFVADTDPQRLERFQHLMTGPISRQDLVESAHTLERLVEVCRECGDRYLASFRAALERHPRSLAQLRDPAAFRELADTLYGRAERFSDLFSRREWLEAYHRLETTSLGLEFLAGLPYEKLLRQYRTDMHILLRSIYFRCRKELYELHRLEWSKRHSLGVYLDAGCVGFQPFAARLRFAVLLFEEDAELESFFREVLTSFQTELGQLGIEATPFPETQDGRLAPVPLAMQRELFSRRIAAGGDALARLEPLRFSRVVGTHGHLQRYTAEVSEPLLAPVRERLAALVREHVDASASALAADRSAAGAAGSVDPVEMRGGVRDLERFYLHLCALSGRPTLCDDEPACGVGDPARGEELAELYRNTVALQSVAAARRLLRWDSPGGEGIVDAGFFRAHAGVLERRPELAGRVITDPLSELRRIGGRNLELMRCLTGNP